MRALSLLLLMAAPAFGQTGPIYSGSGPLPIFPPRSGERSINIIQWDANALPKIYQRSEQLPLTDEEITKLAKAGFDPAQLVKMIEERRCACDASADGLVKLKQQGVPKEVISAVSLHSLRPNRVLSLNVTLDFTGDSNEARESFLYFFVEDGDLTRVLTANIGELLRGRHPHEEMVDQSDLLLVKRVRRIELPGELPLKTYGKHTLLVASSAKPTLTHPSQLTESERQRAQAYTFDYPRSSIQSFCQLTAGYKRDPVLAYKWMFVGSRFACEWN